MSTIEDTVENYMSEVAVDYAIMLTGPWGCGKTYYWKNVLEPSIRRVSGVSEDRASVIYVSLYGVNCVSQIGDAIAWRLASVISGLPEKAKSKLGRFAVFGTKKLSGAVITAFANQVGMADQLKGFSVSESLPEILELLPSKRQLVFCFDDLERSVLNITEILGYINRFVEHSSSKVFLICNEEEVLRIHADEYKQTKEKIVRITRKLPVPESETLQSVLIASAPPGACRKFMLSNFEMVKSIFLVGGKANLRVLRFGLSTLRYAFDALTKLGLEPDATLLRSVLPVAIDFHSGELTGAEVKSVIEEVPLGLLRFSKGIDNNSPQVAHYRKYHVNPHSLEFLRFQSWAELIVEGAVSNARLAKEVAEYKLALEGKAHPLKKVSRDPVLAEDGVFEEQVRACIDAMRNGDFPDFRTLLEVTNMLSQTIDCGLTSLSVVVLDRVIAACLAKSSHRFPIPWETVRDELERPFASQLSPRAQQLLREIRGLNEKALKDARNKRFRECCSTFGTKPGELCNLLTDIDNGLGATPFELFTDAEEISTLLTGASNNSLAYMSSCIQIRYKTASALTEDLSALQSIRDSQSAIIRDLPEEFRIKKHNLRELVDHLTSAIDERVASGQV